MNYLEIFKDIEILHTQLELEADYDYPVPRFTAELKDVEAESKSNNGCAIIFDLEYEVYPRKYENDKHFAYATIERVYIDCIDCPQPACSSCYPAAWRSRQTI